MHGLLDRTILNRFEHILYEQIFAQENTFFRGAQTFSEHYLHMRVEL